MAITTALARLEAVDPGAALDARAALDWLVGEGSLESLCRFGLQQFCWYELPFKWIVAPAARVEVVSGLARFFDLAGLPRYRDVCASPTTAEVLDAWAVDVTVGYDAYRSAMIASGLEPPNLPELVWSPAMEQEELTAFWSTAMALELAVDVGVLVPGRKGWRREQLALVRAHLEHPREDRFGESHLQAVLTERLAAWVEGGWGLGPARRPPPDGGTGRQRPPASGGAAPGPDPGARLDALAARGDRRRRPGHHAHRQGNCCGRWSRRGRGLPRAGGPRRPVPPGAGRRARAPAAAPVPPRAAPDPAIGRDLCSPGTDAEALTDVTGLWRRADQLGRGQASARHPRAGARGAARRPARRPGRPQAELLVVLTETGWHDGSSGAGAGRGRARRAGGHRGPATVLGLARPKGRQWDRRQLRLTEVGRATALAALRSRATAPRRP
jgi:hypothetical protein